jgi:signal transduction histidine kinase/AraC-like DNA-binding protein
LGSLHAEMGHWAQSLDCHKRVLVWASPRHALFVRMANNNIGNTLFRQGQIREAIPYFEKCLQMSISAADKEGQLLGHANLGKVYLSLKMTNEALEQYNKSLALCQQFGDPSSAEMVWKGLANAHEQKGDFKSALHAWKNYHALYDSIEQNLNTERLLKLESSIRLKDKEVELKASELTLSRRENQRNGILALLLLLAAISALAIWFVRKRNMLAKADLERKLAAEFGETQRLQALDELKTRLFVNISHELRTPLTLIESPLKALLGKSVPAQKEDAYLKLMAAQTAKAKTLIDQLIDLARIEAGQTDYAPRLGNLCETLAQCAAPFRQLAAERGVQFVTSGLEDVVNTHFDANKIFAVVQNLLSNAFKYTPPSPQAAIALRLTATPEAILVAVSDNGIGIPEDQKEHLFDRYFQANPQPGSSGIGLSLCQELVRLHGGSINVQSGEGMGSTFQVVLPPAQELIPSMDQTPALLEPMGGSDKPILLLVEDNPDIRDFLTDMLSEQYQLIIAADGEKGWDLALSEVPDLIVSDVVMPRMDGIALTWKLRNHDATSHIPVFLLTAQAGPMHEIEGLESGAVDFIAKPFDPAALLLRLKNRLRTMRGHLSTGESMPEETAVPLSKRDQAFLENFYLAIEMGMPNPDFSIEDLGKVLFLSRSQVYRKVVALTGMSPLDVLRIARLNAAQKLLADGEFAVAEVGYAVGFNSFAYFVKSYREHFGTTPGQARGPGIHKD